MLKYRNRRDVLKPFEENRAYMEERVKAGIELYRKGYCRILITDKEGRPLPGVRVKLNLVNHDFRHGANLFMLDEAERPEKNMEYRKAFAACFHLATIPFYWCDVEPEQGKTRYKADSRKQEKKKKCRLKGQKK